MHNCEVLARNAVLKGNQGHKPFYVRPYCVHVPALLPDP